MTIKTHYKKELKTKKGANYSVAHAGPFEDLHQFEVEHPRLKRNVPKFFLKDELGLTGMQVSLNRMPAGAAVPFYHKHKQNEELYIFIKGKGQMQIDGDIIEVSEGTSIRISPNGERTWRNTGDEDLYCICIQAKENSLSQETFEDGVPVERQVTWP
ncbi:MAG TPA: cupin domain-containing protein [Candidatus Obscuribacterales bacterium]